VVSTGPTLACKKWTEPGVKGCQRPTHELTSYRPLAFERLFREHYASVARYVARRLPRESRDDVVAATFVVAWRKFDIVEDRICCGSIGSPVMKSRTNGVVWPDTRSERSWGTWN